MNKPRQRHLLYFLTGLVALLVYYLQRGGFPPASQPSLPPDDAAVYAELSQKAEFSQQTGRGFGRLEGPVGRAIDGDTIQLLDGTRIRYLAVDTPEKDAPFYRQALELNRRLTEGQRTIIFTAARHQKDAYGRVLGAVFIETGGLSGSSTNASPTVLLVNAELIRQGLAHLYLKDSNPLTEALKPVLLEAQAWAIDHQLGLFPGELKAGQAVLATRYRYHRPGCQNLKAGEGKPMDRETALRSGRSPCRTCRP
ncbi:MAG: thermonuclease family protein [Planctomycetes bacterium]|nr:thermonuclease family protein [Planctomycetota bacterium]